jgi:hypothetical protein
MMYISGRHVPILDGALISVEKSEMTIKPLPPIPGRQHSQKENCLWLRQLTFNRNLQLNMYLRFDVSNTIPNDAVGDLILKIPKQTRIWKNAFKPYNGEPRL